MPRKRSSKSSKIKSNMSKQDFMERVLRIELSNNKRIEYLKRIMKAQISTDEEAIVLDFFSGSASLAHALISYNSEVEGKRKFIMIQLPELCDEQSEAYKAGFKNICDGA